LDPSTIVPIYGAGRINWIYYFRIISWPPALLPVRRAYRPKGRGLYPDGTKSRNYNPAFSKKKVKAVDGIVADPENPAGPV
jgi:hypothetical protein